MQTKEEINNTVQSIVDTVKQNKRQVEEFAKSKGFGHVGIREESTISPLIREKYPEIDFTNYSYNQCNDIDSLVSYLHVSIIMLYPNALQSIRFDSINENNLTVKLNDNSTYSQYHFENHFFGTENKLFSNKIKEYKNGSVVYQLTKDQFDKFKEVVYFTSDATTQILNAITPEDKLNYLEIKKSSYGNVYNVIHDIKERLDIKGIVPINYYVVFNELKM